MNKFESYSRFVTWFMALLLSALAAGCGGGGEGRNPILGIGGIAVLAPTVTAVSPVANATGVPISTKIITAAFSKPMNPATLTTASFTLACPAGTPVAGVVTYLAAGNVATLTLPALPNLPPLTVCTATVTTGAQDTIGLPLASNFVWTFTTGVTPDTTRPSVTLTVPATTIPGPTAGVPTNTAITAVFSEDMAPATITAASFTVTGPGVTPVAGAVTYVVGSRTAVFTPTPAGTVLAAGTTYTATITTAATDLAGNALAGNQPPPLPAASNYVWTFTTAAPVPPANVSVASTNPLNVAVGVCPNATINATFTVPSGLRMDPLTVTTGTFTVTGPALTVVTASSVVLDVATGRIATFTPQSALTNGVTYTATIKGGATGVKDLAIPANTMVADFVWTFTAGPATGACLAPVALGAAAPFGFFSSAALTNQGDFTVINGDAGTTSTASSITGLHDIGGRTYTETCPAGIAAVGCGLVNGTIYASNAPVGDPALGTEVTAARAAALTAFNNLAPAVIPGGLDVRTNSLVGAGGLPGELGGRTLAPGVYASTAGGVADYQITTGNLTLDAQGNANAVWVFQVGAAGTLLVSTPTGPVLTVPRSVLLINGAQAKNVFWWVPAGATINTGSQMVGTMIGNAAITFSTATGANPVIITRLEGRALVLTAGATMVNTIINVPAP